MTLQPDSSPIFLVECTCGYKFISKRNPKKRYFQCVKCRRRVKNPDYPTIYKK
jgi:predicted SprT family Zn-dependent metalloprotease